jgi:NADP-dependent 3-hydroxy acid dehydrogenase YdfG
MTETQRVWFITGCSSGFGRAYAQAVIAHGDKLIATARNVETLHDLTAQAPDRALAAAMDVTDASAIARAVDQALWS